MLKGAVKYSPTCKIVNKTANNNVTINPELASLALPDIKEKCTQVIEKPDNNNKAVFNIGTPKGFKPTIFTGGHTAPNKIDGDKLE